MAHSIKIGTCGFRMPKHEYSALLKCVEIQQTFYQPPMVKTLEKWRLEVPSDFEFTLKAWQIVTHESSSPTYKRVRKPLSEKQAREAGFFKWNETVREGLKVTLDCADALQAKTILFQCPAKFTQTKANIKNLSRFFELADRGYRNFAWEPRGPWDPEIVKKICDDLDLWHTVDPYKVRTTTTDRCYYRLHGIVRWRYTFEQGELEELVSLLPEDRLAYVFFNNITMTEDALRFSEIVRR